MKAAKKSVLFIITGDPRISPRPAEAVRIAAGLATGGRAEVDLCLRGPALLALGPDAEALLDGAYFGHYLPLATTAGRRILVQSQPAGLSNDFPAPVKCTIVNDAELARRAASSDVVMHF